MRPAVTAIITTYNRATYLEEAVRSVLRQSFVDFELIILDNSSEDETGSVVQGFNDPRLCYIKHEPLNISQARNLGVKEAQAEYIAFLDDDDQWLPEKLERQVAFFQKADPSVALVYGGFVRFDSNGRDFHTHEPWQRGKILRSLLRLEDEFTGSASNPMLRKAAVLNVGGFDEAVRTGEDWELYLRLAEKYDVDFITEPVVRIRHHFGSRLSDRLMDYLDLETRVLDRFKSLIESDEELHSFWLQRLGGKFIRLGMYPEGRRMVIQAIRRQPGNGTAYVQYLSSFLGGRFYRHCHKVYLNHKRTVKV
jgi:glycosyltransferase involved in cell wall biosynthesis